MRKINFRSGQTIIEAVVALGLIVVVLTATSVVTSSSINNSQFIKNQSIASKYASQGLESLRYLRNNPPPAPTPSFDSYAPASPATATYCMSPSSSPTNVLLSAGPCNADNFSGVLLKREVKFEANAQDCSGIATPGGTKLTVTVYWSSGKCPSGDAYCHKTQQVSCLSKPSSSSTSL